MPDRPRIVVAVDGPSGSGKSSVSRAVAERLDLCYLDTGAMYRAVCLSCLDAGIDLSDEDAVAARARRAQIQVSMDPCHPEVLLDGRRVTIAIRDSAVSLAVSDVARNRGVRTELVSRQRALIEAADRGCIAEGRDITTVVAPDADVRILLTADADQRIGRRARQVHGHDGSTARALTLAEIVDRDARDSTVTAFLEPAAGVTVLDTSLLSFRETVSAVLALIDAAVTARSPR